MHLRTRLALARFCPPVTVARCLDSRAGELERGWPPDCFAAGSGPTFRAHYMWSGVTSSRHSRRISLITTHQLVDRVSAAARPSRGT